MYGSQDFKQIQTWSKNAQNANRVNGIKKMNEYTIEDMQRIAIERDGVCLSKYYLGSGKKMKWKCNKDGYEWEATPNSIFRGSWCLKCYRKKQIKKNNILI